MFKSQLQEYAQKAGLPAPIYDITKEGPPHEPQFKASVTIHGKIFESPAFFGNLKKAEHAAAEMALASLGKTETGHLHESGLCKNLLQEYAQKCKLPLPVYSVVKTGEVPSAVFSATVEIAGIQYHGGNCKTKKEAEIKAARTALVAICADSGAVPLVDAVEDQAVDEKPVAAVVEKPAAAVVEKAVAAVVEKPVAAMVEKRAAAVVEKPVAAIVEKPVAAVVEKCVAAVVEKPTAEGPSEPKAGKKRKKLCKVGDVSNSRKQKVKEKQDEGGNSEAAVDNSEQADGSAAEASTLQVPKQDVPEQELAGSPADSCTAAAAKVTSCNSGSAQEQRA